MWHEVGHRSDRATVPFRLPGPANPPTATVQLPRTEDDDEADLDEDAQVVDHAVDHDDEHLRVRVRVRARVRVRVMVRVRVRVRARTLTLTPTPNLT